MGGKISAHQVVSTPEAVRRYFYMFILRIFYMCWMFILRMPFGIVYLIYVYNYKGVCLFCELAWS